MGGGGGEAHGGLRQTAGMAEDEGRGSATDSSLWLRLAAGAASTAAAAAAATALAAWEGSEGAAGCSGGRGD